LTRLQLPPLVVGAPFGNWFSYPGVVSTIGTYTWEARGGPWRRLWRMVATLRYHPGVGWTNKLGLPNLGIRAVGYRDIDGKILSIHGFNEQEWNELAGWVLRALGEGATPVAIELNLGCPNVGRRPAIGEVIPAVRSLMYRVPLLAKLPPVRWLDVAVPLWDAGVNGYHCCNTMPIAGGGLSGSALKPYSLWAIRDIRSRLGEHPVLLGGGGFRNRVDYIDYRRAGADSVAIASVLLNPFNWRAVRREVAEILERERCWGPVWPGWSTSGERGLGEGVEEG
jgi:dihydroorotate dehydrogenase